MPDLFVYDGTPAFGNLKFAAAAASGTDAYGNPYLGGNGSYDTIGSTVFAQISDGGNVLFCIYQNGAWVTQSMIETSYSSPPNTTTGLSLQSEIVSSSAKVDIWGPQTGVNGWPSNGGAVYAEFWHDLRPLLQNSFTCPTGYTPLQARQNILGRTEILGWVTLPTGAYDGLVIAQLPLAYANINQVVPAYRPSTLVTYDVRVEYTASATLNGTPYMEVDSSGNLRLRKVPGGLSGVNVDVSGSFPSAVSNYITS